jgi:hypothetical protein
MIRTGYDDDDLVKRGLADEFAICGLTLELLLCINLNEDDSSLRLLRTFESATAA